MRIIFCLIFAAMFMIVGLATVSNAQTPVKKPGIDALQHQNQVRIADGINDGSLTAAEAEHLQKREAAIRRIEASFRESGSALGRMERHMLQVELKLTSRKIFKLRHNQPTP